jgi:hypothetical protein
LVRRSFFSLAAAAGLLVLLAVLGTLQYRWLGEVSNAERERLRVILRTRATDFSRDFDREITRAYMAFRADPELFSGNAASCSRDVRAARKPIQRSAASSSRCISWKSTPAVGRC